MALLFLSLLACDNDSLVQPPGTAGPRAPVHVALESQHALPTSNELYRMWGFSDGTFYAVGDAGTVLHYDTINWSSLDVPVREDLHGIWASDPDNVYVCGFAGTLVHYDGSAWRPVETPTREDLYAVWVNTDGDLFLVGTGGRAWQKNDDEWNEHEIEPGRRFSSLWGYGSDELYAAGAFGALFRFDGVSWTKIPIGTNPNATIEIKDCWGPGPSSLAIVAGTGLAWFDGPDWRVIPVQDENSFGLWGFSLDEQVVVSAGSSTHWENGSPTRHFTPFEEPLFDVWGTSMSDLYAVGRNGNAAHFDGSGWQAMSEGSRADIRDIFASMDGSAVAVGADGTVLRRNGATWDEETVGANYDLAAVWQDGGRTVAVGRYTPDLLNWREAILVNDGATWIDVGPVGNAQRLFDVWGSAADDITAVGWAGEVVHFDGIEWKVVDTMGGDAAFLRSISGASADHMIAVGRTDDLKGLVCQYNGFTWAKTVLPNVEELCGVWVESRTLAIAVGSFGAIRRFDGSTWSIMEAPTSELLLAVWGSSSNEIYAAGWAGTLLHYDGAAWTELLPQTNRNITAISGSSATGVLLAGDRGSIWRFSSAALP